MSQEGMQPQQQPQQLAAQIDEIALLRATVAEEEFAWRGTLADAHAWQQHLDGDPDRDRDPVPDPAHRPPPPFAFALRLATDPHPELWLHVELPPRYPATTLADGVDGDVHGDPRAEPTVTLAGPDTSRNELEALQLIMRTRLQEAKDEGRKA